MSNYAWHCVKVTTVMCAFFALIAAACWWTKSGWALWALLFVPSFEYSRKEAGE